MVRTQTRTPLEQRRVRAAELTVVFVLTVLLVLALWQCVESRRATTNLLTFAEIADLIQATDSTNAQGEYTDDATIPGSSGADPLRLGQEGFVLMRANEVVSILWYQSSWDIQQSRVLLERALAHQGWQSLSEEWEPLMSFVYKPTAIAAGGSLLASFYPTEEGCSILIELL